MITIESYCLCGDDLTVSSSDSKTAIGLDAVFADFHSGAGHELFATKTAARRAKRAAEDAGSPAPTGDGP